MSSPIALVTPSRAAAQAHRAQYGEVEGRDHVALAVADRRGDRAQAVFQLLVDERVPLAADLR